MKDGVLSSSDLVKAPAAQMIRYSSAKCQRGEHVSAAGDITLFLDGDGRVQAILAGFPSPGQHGYLLIDRSITGNFMNEYWQALRGPRERHFVSTHSLSDEVRRTCGLVSIPEDADAGIALFETARMRGCWIMCGMDAVSTMVYFEAK